MLGAVKRAVDGGSGIGRFLLTGSVRGHLDTQTWPGTGRLVHLRMWGLTVAEISGSVRAEPFLETLARGDVAAFALPADVPDLRGYVELALRGGYPEPPSTSVTSPAKRGWRAISHSCSPGTPRASTASAIRAARTLLRSARGQYGRHRHREDAIRRRRHQPFERGRVRATAREHVRARTSARLEQQQAVPTRQSAQRYLTDASLLAAVLRIDAPAAMRDGGLLGRLVETFVLAQIRPEVELSGFRPRLYHLREKNGRHEINLLAEVSAGYVWHRDPVHRGATRVDARPGWFANARERFLGGAVLHTGPRPFQLSERIFALPICVLWGSQPRAERGLSATPRPRRRPGPRPRLPGRLRASTASSAAIATASWSRSGSRVVSSCSFRPGHITARTQRRLRLRPANLMSSKEMPAMSGTPRMRVSTSRYQAGRPIGANTKIATTITIEQEARAAARVQAREALSVVGRELQAGLEAGDRLVLGAVVLEHAAQVADAREQHTCSRGRSSCGRCPRRPRTAPSCAAGP